MEDGDLRNCEVTRLDEDVFENEEFSLEGNLDPEVRASEFLRVGMKILCYGTIRIPVFPGAMIVIGDIDR